MVTTPPDISWFRSLLLAIIYRSWSPSFKSLDWLIEKGISLSDACADMSLYPQTMINVPVTRKIDLQAMPVIQDAVRAAESVSAWRGLGNTGSQLMGQFIDQGSVLAFNHNPNQGFGTRCPKQHPATAS